MKKTMVYAALFCAMTLGSCRQQAPAPAGDGAAQASRSDSAQGLDRCNVQVGSVGFTHALNGADSCATVGPGAVLRLSSRAKSDIFCDPNGKLTSSTLPILLTPVDNTKPFTLTAKVTPGFTDEGLYNAADLFVYASDTLWQKLCYEQDERGNHRIVTVRTRGTSDDNNHQQLDVPAVYLRLSSDAKTLASYYSFDKKEWYMVRLYENYYPAQIWVGLASQCPTAGVCTSFFEEISLEQKSVGDFRTGN